MADRYSDGEVSDVRAWWMACARGARRGVVFAMGRHAGRFLVYSSRQFCRLASRMISRRRSWLIYLNQKGSHVIEHLMDFIDEHMLMVMVDLLESKGIACH